MAPMIAGIAVKLGITEKQHSTHCNIIKYSMDKLAACPFKDIVAVLTRKNATQEKVRNIPARLGATKRVLTSLKLERYARHI